MTPEGVTLQHPDCVWIGGMWRAPHSGRSIEIVSPNTEQVVAVVAEADETDMDAAVPPGSRRLAEPSPRPSGETRQRESRDQQPRPCATLNRSKPSRVGTV